MEKGEGLSGYLEDPIVPKYQIQLFSDEASRHSPNHDEAEAK